MLIFLFKFNFKDSIFWIKYYLVTSKKMILFVIDRQTNSDFNYTPKLLKIMDFKRFLVIPIFIGFLAGTFIVLDQLISPFMPIAANKGFGWVTFQAWAMYFMAGCTLKGGARTFLGYIMGIISAILIIKLAGVLGSTGFWAVPLAVFVIVIPMCSMERAHSLIDFVPALFVSSAVFFAFMNYIPNATMGSSAFVILVYCAIGMVYGIVTVFMRGVYEKMVKK